MDPCQLTRDLPDNFLCLFSRHLVSRPASFFFQKGSSAPANASRQSPQLTLSSHPPFLTALRNRASRRAHLHSILCDFPSCSVLSRKYGQLSFNRLPQGRRRRREGRCCSPTQRRRPLLQIRPCWRRLLLSHARCSHTRRCVRRERTPLLEAPARDEIYPWRDFRVCDKVANSRDVASRHVSSSTPSRTTMA